MSQGNVTPRILLFSERNIYEQEVWRCSFYEFERILEQIDSVQTVAPAPHKWYRQGKRLALRAGEYFATALNPGIPEIRLNRQYDIFFAICEKPSELLNVNAVKGWKDHCKTSVCWLPEFYVKDMPLFKSCLGILAQFDHVIFMFAASDPFRKMLKGQCYYLPAGIDALRFCPHPNPPARSIDVLSIGRRSEATHNALLALAEADGLFYVYDTIADLHAHDLAQHRSLMAHMAKRSRYFIVNPGKVNAPEETGGLSEFGYRYFEGAAPGTIMIGDRPRNEEFGKIFNWDDAVVHLPFGSERVGDVIKELDRQPMRQKQIRTTNVMKALLHHDWAYRWEFILQKAGLEMLPQLAKRKDCLANRLALVQSKGVE